MRAILSALVLSLLAVPALASEPGQALDCEAWVFHEPGHRCQDMNLEGDLFFYFDATVVDNDGRLLQAVLYTPDPPVMCGEFNLHGWTLQRLDGAQWVSILDIPDRCVSPGFVDSVFPVPNNPNSGGPLQFDAIHGVLLAMVRRACVTDGVLPCDYSFDTRVYRVEGFTTTFEVLQTYTPTTDLGFRVPAIPEGLPAADYFDTYYGDLATVGDWSQAQPLECGYPASPPSAGDYLTVADPLPDPAPGHGRYYVTAVHHDGQTRYGRKRIGGVVSGRDPAVLPPCNE